MAMSTLYRQRQELKELVLLAPLDEEQKKELAQLVPHMKPSELLRLKVSVLRMMLLKSSQETIKEVMDARQIPESEDELLRKAFQKVGDKVSQAEERVKASNLAS